jgi:DNA replication protein DnaC
MKQPTIQADGWGAKYLSPFQNENPKWQAIFDKAERVIAGSGNVIIIGNRGSGKTRMAAEISAKGGFPMDLNNRIKTSSYRRIAEILIELRDAARCTDGNGEFSVIRHLSGVGLLVIDEFQERGETDWENRMITTIIDRRYADNLPTILIANLQAAEMQQKISPSVISRFNESGGIILCDCPSFRENKP